MSTHENPVRFWNIREILLIAFVCGILVGFFLNSRYRKHELDYLENLEKRLEVLEVRFSGRKPNGEPESGDGGIRAPSGFRKTDSETTKDRVLCRIEV